MKRLLFFTVGLMFTSASLTSCMNNDTVEDDPLYGGKVIYSYAEGQNIVTMRFYDVATWVNMLMVESGSMTNLMDVKSADGNTNYTTSLFGATTITSDGNEVRLSAVSSNTVFYGDLIINTGGKLLSENGAEWTIQPAGSGAHVLVSSSNYSTTWATVESCASYTITNTLGSLTLEVEDFVCSRSGTSSNWDMTFYIRTPNAVDMGWTDITTKQRVISSGSYGMGKTMWMAYDDFTYNVLSDLIQTSALGTCAGVVTSGYITASSAKLSAADPQNYPASSVSVTWTAGSTDCSFSLAISYNGSYGTGS